MPPLSIFSDILPALDSSRKVSSGFLLGVTGVLGVDVETKAGWREWFSTLSKSLSASVPMLAVLNVLQFEVTPSGIQTSTLLALVKTVS